MTLKITLAMDNEAFSECPEMETARILRAIAETIESRGVGSSLSLRDFNGNAVGKAEFEE